MARSVLDEEAIPISRKLPLEYDAGMTTLPTAAIVSPSKHIDPVFVALKGFKKITKMYALFHIGFFILGCLELFGFVLFFSFLTQSTVVAFSLAALVLTVFSYWVILFYLQAKKPHDLLAVHRHFAASYQGEEEIDHLKLAEALEQLVAQLHRLEYAYYALPPFVGVLKPVAEKFSAWWHWKDLHEIKEMLLLHLVEEHLSYVKLYPIDPKAHAGLALAYKSLSRLYQDPRELAPLEEHLFISSEYASKQMKEKQAQAATLAIQELTIVGTYLPEEPWIYTELASLHLELGQPQEATLAYEAFLDIVPDHTDSLLQLGILYFRQHLPAKALRIYHALLSLDSDKAQVLISHYATLHPEVAR